jgi:hypothetical protein
MSEIPIEDTPLLTHVDTNLPAIGLSIAVILCVYLAFVAYREFMADSKMSSVMYEETGVAGRYVYQLPEEEKVCQFKSIYMSHLVFRRIISKLKGSLCI